MGAGRETLVRFFPVSRQAPLTGRTRKESENMLSLGIVRTALIAALGCICAGSAYGTVSRA